MLFSLAINLLILASPIYMLQIFDRVLSSGRIETLLFLTIIAAVAILFMGAIEIVRGMFLQRVGRWLEMRLSRETIEATLRARLLGATDGAQPLRDLATVRTILTSPIINALFDAPWAPLFILVILGLHLWLGLIAVAAAVILFVMALINELAARRPLNEASRLTIENTHAVDAALRNAEAIQAMGMLPNFVNRHAADTEQGLRQLVRAGDRNATLVGISKACRIFVQILILGAGAYLVLAGELTAGGMIAASILLGRALAPIEQMIGGWKRMVAGREAWARLKNLLENLTPDIEPTALPAPKGFLSCQRVGYIVPNREQPILAGIHFAIEPGRVLGVVGPSAAGKSSLCKILVGAWNPSQGHARVDGSDIHLWDPTRLARYVGYLPQDVELFAGTVTENIARLSPEPDEPAVIEAAMAADVHGMILALPKGYDTEIGEGGALLSGGQRQRIGLARAFYGKPKLIVLDEPAASLDARGEQALLRAINAAKGWNATIVIVAHRQRMLRSIDQLLVLQDGRQQAFGPKDEVVDRLRAVEPPKSAQTKSIERTQRERGE